MTQSFNLTSSTVLTMCPISSNKSLPQIVTSIFRATWEIGIECVCQKNARLRVFTACAKFLRALI